MVKYLLSSFSPGMVESKHYQPDIKEISEEEFEMEKQDAICVISNPAFARIFKVPMCRKYIKLQPGDVALVLSTDGGKLPGNASCLPEGLSWKYTRITIPEVSV